MRVAILLHGDVQNDYRVLKTIHSLAKFCEVDLFYISSNVNFIDPFESNENINFFPIKRRDSFWQRILRHTLFTHEFNYLIKEVQRSNVVYTHIWANDLPTLVSGVKLAFHFNAKLIYDSHEIYIETLNQFFPRNPSGIKKYIFALLLFLMKSIGNYFERKSMKKVDCFVTVNKSILEYFHSKYGVSNGVVLMNFPKLNSVLNDVIDLKKKYSWNENSKVLLYQGVLNEGRGLRLLLNTMLILDGSYKLVLIGDGTLMKDLVEFCKINNLEQRVKFTGRVSLEDLPQYTKGADLGVNLLEDFNLSKKMASPNKLFEYIHADVPVISTNSLESSKVIDDPRLGRLVDNSIYSIRNGIYEHFSVAKMKDLDFFELRKKEYSWEGQEYKLQEILN